MSSNIGIYDFIHPSAANPAEKMGKSKANATSNVPNNINSNIPKLVPQTPQNAQANKRPLDTGMDSSPEPNDKQKRRRNCDSECQCSANYNKLTEALLNINQNLDKLKKLDEIHNTVTELSNRLTANDNAVRNLGNDVEHITADLETVKKEIEDFRSQKNKLEYEVKKINLIIQGVSDQEDETEATLVPKIKQLVSIETGFDFKYDEIYRIGAFRLGQNRNIRIRFKEMNHRNAFLNLRQKIKHPVYINEDLPEAIRKAEYNMRTKIRALKADRITITSVNWKKFEIELETKTLTMNSDGSFTENVKPTAESQPNPPNTFLEK